MSVGGNIQALLQVKKNGAKNAIGERVNTWVDCTSILGWLDLSTGDSKHTTFYAKVQESTHIFLCDFTNLKNLSTDWVWNPFSFLTGVISKTDEQETVNVTSDNARMVVNGEVYEILLIDDPMNMHDHLEILSAVVIDKMIYGMNSGKVAFIVTKNGKRICDVIDECSQRGSTILKAQGGYKQDDIQVVMCACNSKEMYQVRKSVKDADPDSFIVVVESHEVHGEGFKMTNIGEAEN